MTREHLTTAIKQEAFRLGFDLAGVCPATAPPGMERFRRWLSQGFAGQMHYLEGRASAYEHPSHVLADVKSLVMLAMNYRTTDPRPPHRGHGRVSRYAWGAQDYHDVIHERLRALCRFVQSMTPEASVRGIVDTAPLLEREFAQLAGLGWVGKNTLLLNQRLGSWFFLAALLTDVELEFDAPHATDHCGTCRACLDACPTDAFPRPYVLDATKCISYLTIELRESIPAALRSGVGDWLFGCDVCQDVCPWNRHVPLSREPAFEPRPDLDPIALAELFFLDDDGFRARFRRTPLWRSKRRGILRNAAIVLGNQADDAAITGLAHGLNDSDAMVRAACAWALGKNAGRLAADVLRARAAIETDGEVQEEIAAALRSVTDNGKT